MNIIFMFSFLLEEYVSTKCNVKSILVEPFLNYNKMIEPLIIIYTISTAGTIEVWHTVFGVTWLPLATDIAEKRYFVGIQKKMILPL